MTSPTGPRKDSFRDRISTRLSTDSHGRHMDAEAQHTRNVTWIFYGVIVVIVVVIVGGLLYGFWETNFKPVATVAGTNVSRSELDGRESLLTFRADRAAAQATTALSEGAIDTALASTRLAQADSLRPTSRGAVAADLASLIFKEQLATQEGISLGADDLDAAVTADGSFPESRLIDALFVITAEQDQGEAATDVGIAEARERAQRLVEELRAGGDAEELAETFGPVTTDSGWIVEGSGTGSEAWTEAIFAAAEGDVTQPVESPTGEQLVAIVRTIAPEDPDEGFGDAVQGAVGADVHRRNVELETLASKLEEQVTADAVAGDFDQVQLAEIFLERNQGNPDDSQGEARASHILYAPDTPLDEDGEPTAVADLPADDPAWAAAEAEAQAAFDELSAIADIDERLDAFATRADSDSDDQGARRGDLGWFARDAMVSEFSDAIWENLDPARGDVLGPVRSEFGWHVILFDTFRSSLDQRVAAAQAALAADGADFATVAAELSDGPQAAEGGDVGWQPVELLDEALAIELALLETGQTTQPVDEGDGFRIYQKLDQATRPLDDDDARAISASAFDDWFFDRYDAADINIDAGLDD